MDSTQTIRSVAASLRARVLLFGIISAGLVAACAGSSSPTASPFTGDPCTLIATADLEAVFGTAMPVARPESGHESATDSTCRWTIQSSGNGTDDHLTLDVNVPGGKADFSSYRQFLAGLLGGPVSPGAAGSPAASGLGSPGGSGISLPSLPGVGDDAFIGAAGTVYALKGDTEVTLQLIALDDPRAQQDTIDLIKKALDRLP
jgi:hypothetical protein